MLCVFCFKQKTAYEMRISDWSSDVCSSDLFAVPAVEAAGVLLLPQMLAARDLPFPRLSAYAFWAYAVGGLCFFASIFVGLAPDGGWFMYPPLTSKTYSPGINTDFWLLGIGDRKSTRLNSSH